MSILKEHGNRSVSGFSVQSNLDEFHSDTRSLIPEHSCCGSALIVVLWVGGLLSILVGSFAFDAHKAGLMAASSSIRNVVLALYFIAFATKAPSN